MPSPGLMVSGLFWMLVVLGPNRDAGVLQAGAKPHANPALKSWTAEALRSTSTLRTWVSTQVELIRLKSEVARLRVEVARLSKLQPSDGGRESGEAREFESSPAPGTNETPRQETPRLIGHRSSLGLIPAALYEPHVARKPAGADSNSPPAIPSGPSSGPPSGTPTGRGVPPALLTAPVTYAPTSIPALPSPPKSANPGTTGTVVPPSSNPCPPGMIPFYADRPAYPFPAYAQPAKAWLYLETPSPYPGGPGLFVAKFLGHVNPSWALSQPPFAQSSHYGTGLAFGYAPSLVPGQDMGFAPPMYAQAMAGNPPVPYAAPMLSGSTMIYGYGQGAPSFAYAPPYGPPAPWGQPGWDGSPPVAYSPSPCPPGTVPVRPTGPAPLEPIPVSPLSAPAPSAPVVTMPPTPFKDPVTAAVITGNSKGTNTVEKVEAIEIRREAYAPQSPQLYCVPPSLGVTAPSYPQSPQYAPYSLYQQPPASYAPYSFYPPSMGYAPTAYAPYSGYSPPVSYLPFGNSATLYYSPPVGSPPSYCAPPPPAYVPTLSLHEQPGQAPAIAAMENSSTANAPLAHILERLEMLEKKLAAKDSPPAATSPAPYAVLSPVIPASSATPNR